MRDERTDAEERSQDAPTHGFVTAGVTLVVGLLIVHLVPDTHIRAAGVAIAVLYLLAFAFGSALVVVGPFWGLW